MRDSRGELFVAGRTEGELVDGETLGGADGYVAKLDADGQAECMKDLRCQAWSFIPDGMFGSPNDWPQRSPFLHERSL